MKAPRLYESYERAAAIDLFGSELQARTTCDGQWVILRDNVLCFSTVGADLSAPHFPSASYFCWVADKPYQVNRDRDVKFLPAEVIANRGTERPVHLFARSDRSAAFIYAGELGPSHRMTLPDDATHGDADFELAHPLPSNVWHELTGFDPGTLDHGAVDSHLARLGATNDVHERLEILRKVVEYWHGSMGNDDGFDGVETDELRLPFPLRWWYEFAGRRKEIMGQYQLLGPTELRDENGLLVFYGENQWCYEWATEREGSDPPVFGRESDCDPFQREGLVLSEHLILACLFEAVMCHSPYGAAASWLDEDVLREIEKHVPPIGVNPWGWLSTRLYAKGGAFMIAMDNGESEGKQGYSVWLGAKTEHPLQFLKPYVDEAWEYVAL